MPQGYAFPRVTQTTSPLLTRLGTAQFPPSDSEGNLTADTAVSPTSSGQAQGPMGRATLAADLNSTTGVAGKALSVMGQLGGPIASLAMTGLKAAMTAHNMAAIAQMVEPEFIADLLAAVPTFSAQPQNYAGIDARGLAQALGVSFGGATGFSSTGVAFGGPGQSPDLTTAQAQAQNLTQTTLASLFSGRTDTGPPATTADPQDTSTSGPTGGGPPGVGSGGVSATEGQYSRGGYVTDRVPGRGDNEPALLEGGEFVIRRQVVPRHRKLLEHINAKAR